MQTALAMCRRHFAMAALFSALANLLYIVPTLYMLQLYDRVVPTGGLQTLLLLTGVLLFALITLCVLDRARQRLLVRAGARLDTILAPLILDASLGRPNSTDARQALREFDQMRAFLSGVGILALFDAPWVPIYIFICFLVHPWIGSIAVVGCVILPLIAWANERATNERISSAQKVASHAYASQDLLVQSADSIRALGMRRASVARQMRYRQSMTRAQTEAGFASGGYLALTKFTRLALQSSALGIGAMLAVENRISAGAIFAASFLIARALQPIEQMIGNWKGVIQIRQGYANLNSLLGAPDLTDHTQLAPPTGSMILEGVTIFNETRDGAIINSISLSILPGEVVAVIGPSGAGKSTLARTIAGAIMPDRGTIRFGHADSRDWDPELLARHIGYLPQDSVLFAGTVAENIARFGGEFEEDKARLDAAIIAAAEKVGAAGLIARLPNGYDYRLQLGGKGVSAGQAQRIALARAVFDNPAILVLDEPNAHLDSDGDNALTAALTALKADGRTILIVSHKLGILPVVDKILMLRDGRIDLFGPCDDVIAKLVPPNLRRFPGVVAKGGAT